MDNIDQVIFNTQVSELHQEIAIVGPFFPPPRDPEDVANQLRSNRKRSREIRKTDGFKLLVFLIKTRTSERNDQVVKFVARELWKSTSSQNRAAYSNLARRVVNLMIIKKR